MATDEGRAVARSRILPAGPALAVLPSVDLGRGPREEDFAAGIRSEYPNEDLKAESTALGKMLGVPRSSVDKGSSEATR